MVAAGCALLHAGGLAATGKTAAAAKPDPNNLKVTGQATYVYWPDPKRQGKPLAQMWARSFEGLSPQQTVYVTLDDVTGYVFENGIKTAKFTAPRVQGDNVQEQIVATGRVKYSSLVPKSIGTYIVADKVVWSAKTNKGVATGNVIVHYAQNGMVVHTPIVYFDTKLRTVESTAGYGTLP